MKRFCCSLLLGAGAIGAPAHSEGREAEGLYQIHGPSLQTLDRSGQLGPHEVLERWQLISWDDLSPPKPGAQGAVAASASRLVFGALAGGFGAGSDIASSKPLATDAEGEATTEIDAGQTGNEPE